MITGNQQTNREATIGDGRDADAGDPDGRQLPMDRVLGGEKSAMPC